MGEYDFAKLIAIGCPLDEYKPEAICLLEQMQKNPQWKVIEVSAAIAEIYKDYFDGIYEILEEDCIEMAKKILNLVNNK